MTPVMYILMLVRADTLNEFRCRAYPWNFKKFSKKPLASLDGGSMVRYTDNRRASRFPKVIRHLTWNRYYVLVPKGVRNGSWFIGRRYADGSGNVSKVPLEGPVRVPVKGEGIEFFAVSANGNQLPLQKIGEGKLGDCGCFRQMPLC
ncbi:MAG: hypothetical protein WDZ93_01065 [Candidatus Paceibacterota bacterium]